MRELEARKAAEAIVERLFKAGKSHESDRLINASLRSPWGWSKADVISIIEEELLKKRP